MINVNSRADLENLRDTPAFVGVMRDIYGSLVGWTLVNEAWQQTENTGVLVRLGFTKTAFMAEIAGFNFPAHVAPPAPPPPPPATNQSITKRQLVAALILGGGITDPDAFIEGAIDAIADPTAKALALNDWRNAPYYVRTHPLFNDPAMLGAIGMGEQEIDGLWALALTLPK